MENKFDFEDEKATNVDVSSEKVKADAKNFVECFLFRFVL